MSKQSVAEFIQSGDDLYVLCHAIRDHMQVAQHLSFTHVWKDFPTINVRWEPARCYCDATPESLHKYHVYVDGITASRDWEITGETKVELCKQWAAGLEGYAEYLEWVARFFRLWAKDRCMVAEYDAKQAERGHTTGFPPSRE